MNVFEHPPGPDRPLLLFKDRFLAKDHPEHSKCALHSGRLRALGLRPETVGHGPERQAFEAELARLGLTRDLRKRVAR